MYVSAASGFHVLLFFLGAWALPQPLFETSFCPPDPKRRLYAVGRTMFETDRLSKHHVQRCNKMDEVWVPTEFHKEVR